MTRARPLGLRLAELIVLVLLVLVAASPLVPLMRVGRPLSGAIGIYAEDQHTYFAWVREASRHALMGNRFDLAPGHRTFFHPALALSGVVHSVTRLPIPLAYFLWAPVAAAVLFSGYVRYASHLLPPGHGRAIAVALGLLSVSPYVALDQAGWISGKGFEEAADLGYAAWTAGTLWGYPILTMGLALMPLILLGTEAVRNGSRGWTLWLTSLGALLISWIHPWQGVTLILVVTAIEGQRLLHTRERPSAAIPIILGAFMLPAVYYWTLTKLDPVWRDYGHRLTADTRPWTALLLTLLPLILPAALAYWRRGQNWQEQAVRLWPLAALLVYVLPIGTYPTDALSGIALPLGILAVRGIQGVWSRLNPVLVTAAIVLLIVPGWAGNLRLVWRKARSGEHGYFIAPSERRALRALESDPRPGGVLSPVSTGAFIPFTTGREVYVGHDAWSPDFDERSRLAHALFAGRLSAEEARTLVRATRARFLFADCRHRYDLGPALRPLLANVTQYGCATVYELKEQPGMAEAAGPPDQ
jgi:hypothetical protein